MDLLQIHVTDLPCSLESVILELLYKLQATLELYLPVRADFLDQNFFEEYLSIT